MPKHDKPNQFTSYNAGQLDAINGDTKEPKRWSITDGHRLRLYLDGYNQEIADMVIYEGNKK